MTSDNKDQSAEARLRYIVADRSHEMNRAYFQVKDSKRDMYVVAVCSLYADACMVADSLNAALAATPDQPNIKTKDKRELQSPHGYSKCCNAPLGLISSNEGTSYYRCSYCGKASDPVLDQPSASDEEIAERIVNTFYLVHTFSSVADFTEQHKAKVAGVLSIIQAARTAPSPKWWTEERSGSAFLYFGHRGNNLETDRRHIGTLDSICNEHNRQCTAPPQCNVRLVHTNGDICIERDGKITESVTSVESTKASKICRAFNTEFNAASAPSEDTKRLDWLCEQVVEVRQPLQWGSRQLFIESPEEQEGESDLPSNLRAAIDAAMNADKDNV